MCEHHAERLRVHRRVSAVKQPACLVSAQGTDFVGKERCFRCQAYLLCKLPSLERRIIVSTNSVALMVNSVRCLRWPEHWLLL